jgi:hypothetical protein
MQDKACIPAPFVNHIIVYPILLQRIRQEYVYEETNELVLAIQIRGTRTRQGKPSSCKRISILLIRETTAEQDWTLNTEWKERLAE